MIMTTTASYKDILNNPPSMTDFESHAHLQREIQSSHFLHLHLFSDAVMISFHIRSSVLFISVQYNLGVNNVL